MVGWWMKWLLGHGLADKIRVATSEDDAGNVPSSGRYVIFALAVCGCVLALSAAVALIRGTGSAGGMGSVAAIELALLGPLAYLYKTRSSQ